MSDRYSCARMMLALGVVLLSASTTFAQPAEATGETPLIPRATLFGNPERARVRVSPDGRWLAFLAPVDGVLNVWVAPRDRVDEAKPVTADNDRGVREYFWTYTNRHLVYLQDKNGDEDYHAYSVDLDNDNKVLDLTPFEQISARIEAVSERFPEEILIAINNRGNHELHDLYRVNVATGERELLIENPGFLGFLTDDDYNVRLAVTYTPDASQVLLKRDGEDWRQYVTIGAEDSMTTGPAGFDKSGEKLYLIDSRERNTAALKLLDLNTDKATLIAENPRADISSVLTHPTEKHVQAVSFEYERREWKVLDKDLEADFDYLRSVEDGEVEVTSRTLDDRFWTVAYFMDDGPIRFYLYEREPRKAQFLFTTDPELEEQPLVKMHHGIIRTRDDLELVSYLSLPEGSHEPERARPRSPLPMVLLVHGGPWARDSWGYSAEHQLLANRGYAVLSVNFRGSTGFGKKFINAADREWAAGMHNDLLDAVNWAVREKIADPKHVAIMGASYGGYATLVGLTFTPQVFACGVDVVGPSNLITLLENPPPYWMPIMPVMKRRVGDWTSDEGRKLLTERSPLTRVDKIERPLLIAQGKNDPRVKQAESDQIVAAMEEKDIPVTYLLFTEEGHGFARPENRFAFYAVAEAFLAEHLGGRYEPIGDAFDGAAFTVPSGAGQVPGLEEAIKEMPPAAAATEEQAP